MSFSAAAGRGAVGALVGVWASSAPSQPGPWPLAPLGRRPPRLMADRPRWRPRRRSLRSPGAAAAHAPFSEPGLVQNCYGGRTQYATKMSTAKCALCLAVLTRSRPSSARSTRTAALLCASLSRLHQGWQRLAPIARRKGPALSAASCTSAHRASHSSEHIVHIRTHRQHARFWPQTRETGLMVIQGYSRPSADSWSAGNE